MNNKNISAINCIMCLFGLLALSAQAASFDCAKAETKIEKLICGDAELSRLDEETSAAYKAALKDVKHADFVRQSQQQWIKERNVCKASDCVKRSYERQLSTLKLPIITTPAGKPIVARFKHTATLLPDGKVLIAGGAGDDSQLNNAELYDPATNRFSTTGNLLVGRREHSATILPNGKVLLVGGTGESITEDGRRVFTIDTGELYDPVSGTFSATQSIPLAVYAITPLQNGKILFTRADDAALYDPATGTSNAAGKPVGQHLDDSATPLQNGKTLFIEDYTAELYDPATNRFTATGSLSINRHSYSATLLSNGKVLVAGGIDTRHSFLASAELYDPTTGRFTSTGDLVTARHGHSAILLQNGKVLIAGEVGRDGFVYGSLELYDPATGAFSSIGRLASSGIKTATRLQNGKVLFVGGDTAELYDPAAVNP